MAPSPIFPDGQRSGLRVPLASPPTPAESAPAELAGSPDVLAPAHVPVAAAAPAPVPQPAGPMQVRGSKLKPTQGQISRREQLRVRAFANTALPPPAVLSTRDVTLGSLTLTTTQAVARGAYCKFLLAQFAHEPKALLGVRQLRLADRAALRRDGALTTKSTAYTYPHDHDREVEVMAAVQAHVRPRLIIRLPTKDARVRKVLWVVPLMEGDMHSVRDWFGSTPSTHRAIHMTERARVGMLMLHDVARDAARLHEVGYVHADLKLANLLFDRTGHVHLADYGLVKPLRHGRAKDIIGTYEFMPPEIYSDDGVGTAAVDVWSLGICYLNLITGRRLARYEEHPVGRGNEMELFWRDMEDYAWFVYDAPRLGAGNDLDLLAAARNRPDRVSSLVRAACAVNLPAATYVFSRMLHPEPKQRDSMDQVRDRMTSLLAYYGGEAQTRDLLLRAAPAAATRTAWKAALATHQAAVADSPHPAAPPPDDAP